MSDEDGPLEDEGDVSSASPRCPQCRIGGTGRIANRVGMIRDEGEEPEFHRASNGFRPGMAESSSRV